LTDVAALRLRLAALERALGKRDYHLAEIERRLANVMRSGTVHAVDPDNGLIRVKIGTDRDGEPVLTPWLPWTERAGRIKTWLPPAVGEVVRVHAPSGEIAQGWVDPGGFSSANPAPSSDGEAHVEVLGDTRVTIKDGSVRIETKAATIVSEEATVESEKVVIKSGSIDLGGEDGKRLARVGDRVQVGAGSSAGLWPIVEGSTKVRAID